MSNKTFVDEAAPPDLISEIINGFQYETTVDVPGPKGSVFRFVIGVLWEDEDRAIIRNVGLRINPHDYEARLMEMRFERVVQSIVSITNVQSEILWTVRDPNLSEEQVRARSMHLRKILGHLPKTVEYLYEKYLTLCKKRDDDFVQAIADLKKSSRTPAEPVGDGNDLPDSLLSGEDGGKSSEPGAH